MPEDDGAWGCDDNFVCAPDENQRSCPHDCFVPPLDALPERVAGEAVGDGFVRCGPSLNFTMASICPRTCGNLAPDPDETVEICPHDFPLESCGNSVCDPDEYLLDSSGVPIERCPTECHAPSDNGGSFGDGICDVSETPLNSPDDCTPDCHDGVCSKAEFDLKEPWCKRDCEECLAGGCWFEGDTICDGAKGENMGNSPEDCKVAMCGDNYVSSGESCDDGNLVDTDECTNACKWAECGDGVIEAGVDDCDDGNVVNTDACLSGCVIATCGDEEVWANVEDCDDGNEEVVDECVACKWAVCGDNHVRAGVEGCDDGNKSQEDGCLNDCTPASCGDGFVHEGIEDCEDGNQVNTDACLNTCKAASCGDGFVQKGVEACDDGNQVDGDGCRKDCLVHRLVFVTSATFSGVLGGLNLADQKCKDAALDAGLANSEKFKAWLSDGFSGPSTRFGTSFTGVYELVDGTMVARGWSDLIDGKLDHGISLDEKGGAVSDVVWTNTNADGTPVGGSAHCNAWTDESFSFKGTIGISDPAVLDAQWTLADNTPFCQNQARIYCFEN